MSERGVVPRGGFGLFSSALRQNGRLGVRGHWAELPRPGERERTGTVGQNQWVSLFCAARALRITVGGIVALGWSLTASAAERQWVVLASGGGVKLIEAMAIEEAGAAVLITDSGGKKGGYNLSAIQAKLPAAPDGAVGVAREDAEVAMREIDEAAAKFPTIAAGLQHAKAGWERCIAAMVAEEAKRQEATRRVDAYLAQRPDGIASIPATKVEKHIGLGEALIAHVPERAAEIQAHIESWRALLAQKEDVAKAMPARQLIPEEALRLASDFKLRVRGAAAPAGTVGWILGAVGVSVMCFMYCAMRGLERLLRAPVSALGYLGCAAGGMGMYVLLGVRLFEAPQDFVALKAGKQGEPAFVEKVVALSQHRAQIEGDAGGLESVSLHDGGLNLFLADRVEYLASTTRSPLEPVRSSISVDVRDDAVLFYEEVKVLGLPMLVTLIAPVEGQMNALRFGEPAGRIGTWTVLPRSLVAGLWDNLRGSMATALADAGIPATFNVERISEGSIHLVLRPTGAIGPNQGSAVAERQRKAKTQKQ